MYIPHKAYLFPHLPLLMVKISWIKTGETEGISNTGEAFTEEGMEFFSSQMMEGMEISSSYLETLFFVSFL